MEGTKKRKRDADLPRITYDAGTRTFDRLFKEVNLEGLKEVVRKKLGVSVSTSVHLAQLRDGKAVDLEDGDDFEAFSSSAYHGLTAIVKVTVGDNSTATGEVNRTEDVLEDGPLKKRSRKEKKKAKQNETLEDSEMPETALRKATALDSQPPLKKRRVSFFESSEALRPLMAESTLSPNEQESTPEQEPSRLGEKSTQEGVSDLDLTTEERRKKKKKDKKEKREKDLQKELGADISSKESTPVDTEPRKKKKKKKKDAALDNENSIVAPLMKDDLATKTAAVPGKSTVNNAPSDDATQKKQSKKRARDIEPSNVGADKMIAPNLSAEPEASNKSKAMKKQKKVHKTPTDVTTGMANGTTISDSVTPTEEVGEVLVLKTAKKLRRKSDAQPPAPSPMSEKQSTNELNGGPKESNDLTLKPNATVAVDTDAIQLKTTSKPVVEVNTAKTPKKTTKKKVESSESTSQAEKDKEAARALMQAILARKANPGNPAIVVPGSSTDPAQPTHVAEPVPPGALVKSVTGPVPASTSAKSKTPMASSAQTKVPQVIDPALLQASTPESSSAPPRATTASTSETPLSKASKGDSLSKCSVCDEEPWHIRSKCPIVKKGIKSMQKRIAELEKEDASEDVPGGHAELIAELHTLIEGKRRKPRASLATATVPEPQTSKPDAAASAVKSVVDASTPSTAVNVVPSPAVEPSNGASISTKKQLIRQPVLSSKAILSAGALSSTRPILPTKNLPSSSQPPLSQPPPSTQPRPVTQQINSSQPPLSTQPKPSKNVLQKSKAAQASDTSLFPSPLGLSLANVSFSALGDISSYTDRDLEALMRGPKLTSKDVLSEDDEMSVDEEPAVLEEDEVLIRGPRKSSQRDYPSSSDEADNDEDEDEVSLQPTDSATNEERRVLDVSSAPTPSAEGSDELAEAGQRSFHDLDETNTSRRSSLGNAGDIAALAAIHADVDTPTPSPPPTSAAPAFHSTDPVVGGDSDNTATSHDEERGTTSAQMAEQSDIEEADPIETVEEVVRLRTESIASEDESVAPRESTPKIEVLCKRSQGNKPTSEMTSQSQPAQETEEVTPKAVAGRRTRSLTRLTEMPIPNFRARTTPAPPPPVTPRATRLRTRAASQMVEEAVDIAASKAASKTPARAVKTPLKLTSKAADKVALPVKTPVKPSKTAAKASAPSKVAGSSTRTTRASRLAADLESTEENEEDVEAVVPPAEVGTSLASWDILPDNSLSQSGPSQIESENTMMVDELISSPAEALMKAGSSKQAMDDDSQDPLFIYSETQQSFPYSQYPIPPERGVSPASDSDDEDEVVAAVRPSTRPRQSVNYRTLTEITSQPTIFAPRYSSQMANNSQREPLDLFGTNGKDDDEESQESETESEPDNQPKTSHIPATRRAGAAVPRRK